MALQKQQLSAQKSYSEIDTDKLFFTLVEELKLPLIQIARTAELANINNGDTDISEIEKIAEDTIEIIDSYILSTYMQAIKDELTLQPVSLSASLQDAAHKIFNMANQNNCDLELEISGKYGPVMAHPAALISAFVNLGYVFINSNKDTNSNLRRRKVIKLATHKTRFGITAGLFMQSDNLNSEMLRQARRVYGRAKQPLNQLVSSTGVGVFIADSLLKQMSGGLRVAHYHKLNGLAATFTPSKQLVLV